MSGSGFFLSLSGPAAILTLLIQPTIRDAADQWSSIGVPVVPSVMVVAPDATDTAPQKTVVEVASIPNTSPRPAIAPGIGNRQASEQEAKRLRKPLQEGCERSISSLAGPEARRMVPGRCMA